METGQRFGKTELSSIDTTLLLGGVLFASPIFRPRRSARGRNPPPRRAHLRPRRLAAGCGRGPLVAMGWNPEEASRRDWHGYNEAMLVYVLALGARRTRSSPRLAGLDRQLRNSWGTFGQRAPDFPPLFGHQYSQVWLDLRGVRDDVHARARHRLFREQPARDASPSATTRSPIRCTGAATAPTSGD